MNELEFAFAPSPWETALQAAAPGSTFSAAHLLTLLEDEDDGESAVQLLNDKHIALDITAIPKLPATGPAAARLRAEQQWAEQGKAITALDENDPLRLYLEEIAMLPAAGDTAVLAMELASGNADVIPALTNLMLGYTVQIAKTYVGHGVLLMDLIQEASLGLWYAMQNYQGGDFEAHCLWWIRQYIAEAIMLQAFAAGGGQKLRQSLEDFRSVDEKLLSDLGRNPTVAEIAEALHISEEEAQMLSDMLENARLLQRAKQPEPEQLPQEEDQAVEDTAYFQMRQRISELLSALPEQEATLLTLRYGLEGGLPMNPRQVADRLNLTEDEVTRIETAALVKLRQQN